VELIVAQRPDLVVFYASPSNEVAITQLETLGVAAISLRTDKLEDLVRAARILGRLTGTATRADSLIDGLNDDLTALAKDGREGPEPLVLILAWDNPPVVVGSESFLSEIVTLGGGRNVFGDSRRPSFATSVEMIAQRDPDLVLVASDSGLPEWASRPEWQAVGAVRDRRFVMVAGSEFSRPSFRAPDAALRLRKALSLSPP
jgi:ABC-type Fe3+-hydroxamate transport system substrate-binding protein